MISLPGPEIKRSINSPILVKNPFFLGASCFLDARHFGFYVKFGKFCSKFNFHIMRRGRTGLLNDPNPSLIGQLRAEMQALEKL
jgi:hypothetical protein